MTRAGFFVTALLAGSLFCYKTAQAQYLDEGKSAAQLFAANCTACHRSPRGLAKGRSASTLAGFLRQHYTTGRQPAAEIAGYLASVGGAAPAQTNQAPPQAAPRAPDNKDDTTRAKSADTTTARVAPELPPRRPRNAGELVNVSTDPDPVTISAAPTAMTHHRASSRAQEDQPAFGPPPSLLARRDSKARTGSTRTGDNSDAAEIGTAGPEGSTASAVRDQAPQPFAGPLP